MAKTPKKLQTVATVDFRDLRKAKALRLHSGQCIRVVVGGKFIGVPGVRYEGDTPPVKTREFRICGVGGAGKAGAIQVSTPDVRQPGEPYGTATRKILVGDRNKMCRFGWPLVHYESDLLPEHKDDIQELHGVSRRTRKRRKKRS